MKKASILVAAGFVLLVNSASAQSPDPAIRLPPIAVPIDDSSRTTIALAAVPIPTIPPLDELRATAWPGELPEPMQSREFEPSTPSELNLADLEAMAIANNPTLAQASARMNAARSTWVQVGLFPNPRVGYQGTEIGDEGRAGQQGLILGQEFVTGRKLRLDRNAAAQVVRQAEQEFAAQQMRVLNDVRIGYFETLVAQRRVEITGQLLDVGEQGLETTDQLLKAQEVTQADLLQARIELNGVRILATNAHNGYLSAWRRLASTVGAAEMKPVWIRGDVGADQADLSWDQSLRELLDSSPELMAARFGIDQARWAVRRAWAQRVPNVDVQVSMQHDNATSDDIVGVQAILPVPLFNRNQGGIGRAQAELMVAQREVDRLELELLQKLAVAFERYTNAKHQVEQYATEILPDAKESLDLATNGYRQGEFSYLNLLTIQRTYFQTNLAYLDALEELWTSRVTIEGLLLTGSLNADSAPRFAPGATYQRAFSSPQD